MLGMSESLKLGTILANILKGIFGNIAQKQLQEAYTAFIQKQGRFVNHDLEKALRRSFLLAQYKIASECRQELVQSSRMVYRHSLRIGILEHEADIRKLGKKLKQLDGELKKVKQLAANVTPVESLNDLGLLLTGEGKLDKKWDDIKKKLLAEAVEDDSVPCYKAKAEASFMETMCAYFAFEIKTNQAMRDVLQTQLLAEIHLTSEDLEKSLQDVAKKVPQVLTKLENLGVAIQQVDVKQNLLESRLEDVMEGVTAIAGDVQQTKAMLKQLLQGKQVTPRPVIVVKIHGDPEPQKIQEIIQMFSHPQLSADVTIEFLGSKKGSILLFFEGSQEGFERLEQLFRSGELEQTLGVPVEAVQSIDDDLDEIWQEQELVFTPTPEPQSDELGVESLRQWLEGIYSNDWQPVEQVLTSSRRSGDQSELGVSRAKVIDLGMQLSGQAQAVALIVSIMPEANGEVSIQLRLYPASSYSLPEGLQLIALDEFGDTISYVQASIYDNRIQMELTAEYGDSFSVRVALGDVSIMENFVI